MIPIETDLFDIADRLKAIDPSYRLYYNTRLSKYQLYRVEKGKEEYQLTFPFDTLDCRCVTHCLKTRGENAEKLIEELERQNMENEKKELDNAKKAFEDKAERYLRKL